MKYLFYIKTALILGLILRGGISDAQTTLQVVTKLVERTVDCPTGFTLNIDAEKADITLKAMPNIKEIKLKLELISKNPNLQNAKMDIDAIKYIINSSSKSIYIRNYVGIEKGQIKPSSELKVRYTIIFPNNITTNIKNNFGKLSVNDLKSNLNLNVEFCKVTLTNIVGNLSVVAGLSDVQATGLEGDVNVQSTRCDVQLSILRGACDVKAHSGKIRIDGERELYKLTINAQKADVLYTPPIATYIIFDLDAEYGKIDLPSNYKITLTEKNKTREKVKFTHYEPVPNKKRIAAAVSIITQFSNIEIGTKL